MSARKDAKSNPWPLPTRLRADCIEYERQALTLRAEVKDLKARLKAARAAIVGPNDDEWFDRADKATDLRVKNWRAK